jgi:hypothetical protein
MKKLLLLTLFIGFTIRSARSQVLIALVFGDKLNTPNIEFGLNVGGNFSTLIDHPEAKYNKGINFGLYFNFKLSDHLYLHPELQFMNKMGSRGIDERDLPGSEFEDPTLKTWRELNYATLVFLPRYKLTNQLYFEAGIHGSLLLSADDLLMVNPEDKAELVYKRFIRSEITTMDVGFDVGLGYKFGKGEGVNLSLRYSQGFINTLKDDSLTPEYNRGFHVQVGIPIGLGKEDVENQLPK